MRILPMCLNCCKIKTYIGFAKRSKTIIYGVDDIEKQIGRCGVILFSSALSESSAKNLERLATKKHIQIYKLEEEDFNQKLDSIVIKAVAITDKNLSEAIKKELD